MLPFRGPRREQAGLTPKGVWLDRKLVASSYIGGLCVANGRLRHMLIGYARVSKTDGFPVAGPAALRPAGVDDAVNLYHDFASGLRDDRPGLDSLPARPAEGRRARGLEARPPRPQPRPSSGMSQK